MDDFYALSLDKLDRYTSLKPIDVVIPADANDESSDEDEDDEDDEDEDDEESTLAPEEVMSPTSTVRSEDNALDSDDLDLEEIKIVDDNVMRALIPVTYPVSLLPSFYRNHSELKPLRLWVLPRTRLGPWRTC